MTNSYFSFIILTFNEETNLPRLLRSIEALNANTYIFDSGSTDETLSICKEHHLEVVYHQFTNHPAQWDAALQSFKILTPWVICLDADQVVSKELSNLLSNFKNENYETVNGIYFNRKYHFRGTWIRFGGYFPKYLLKMFRYGIGYSDLEQNMDHKFQVPSGTVIWKEGYLIEENLKENKLSFWLEKHNRYSDLLAEEEILSLASKRFQKTKPKLLGSPNERKAWYKKVWWGLPRYIRPFLYFFYRIIFRLGFLDGRTAIIFHFLQAFWFRLVVDIKIEEQLESRKRGSAKFILTFLTLFSLFYGFNHVYIGLTIPGNYYNSFLDDHLNYIALWRYFDLSATANILEMLGYEASIHDNQLINHGFSGFRLAYSCLGYGVMSCFAAYVIAYPKPTRSKMAFLILGLLFIQTMNIIRFILIAIYYNTDISNFRIDHHQVYNSMLYLTLVGMVYFWTKAPSSNYGKHNAVKKEL